ncbi:uncharacterized protein LOC135392310 [Ornithodoros turicata]|uniref:uncharacterized protein LOC135392310 n=1 Tax=Ornithodoros turicata TaxID=34597 RepID=UPI0031391815
MPHHAVIREDRETTKVRIVFDISSKAPGAQSLNDILEPGPNLNPDMLKLLLTFRLQRIAIIADIEKASLQILLDVQDRDFLRFFWYETTPSVEGQLPRLEIWRMTRVPFGATSSTFLLAATIHHHLQHQVATYPWTTSRLKARFYVDDLVTGAEDTQEVMKLFRETLQIFETASMPVRKWLTNSPTLQQEFERSGYTRVSTVSAKVLGITWHTGRDDLTCSLTSISEFLKSSQCTKRHVLRSVSRLFDPFGFLAPFTITPKILFQSLWEEKTPWDATLTTASSIVWNTWCSELNQLTSFALPRILDPDSPDLVSTFSLHAFCDASPHAYGAVVYFRNPKTCRVTFAVAKSRVAPLKRQSLPRLELMAAVLAARLLKTVTEAFSIVRDNCNAWTDSMIALSWIRTAPSRLIPFSSLWVSGPPWLQQATTFWPPTPNPVESPPDAIELNAQLDVDVSLLLVPGPPTEAVLSINNFSSFTRLLAVTEWIFRFIQRARRSTNAAPQHGNAHLSADGLHRAEQYWIKTVQQEVFGPNPAVHENLRDLSVFIDTEGILRLTTRLVFSGLNSSTINPIILPGKHYFTWLMITYTHVNQMHTGVQGTLAQLRERFWIIRGRQAVKRVIYACVVCRRFGSKATRQATASLPPDRLSRTEPFHVTGLDFAGPIYYRTDRSSTTPKSYIVLFTCAVTRAVHLELASSMTTDDILQAFRRFIARRSIPAKVYSDNIRTFKRASTDLAELGWLIHAEPVQRYCAVYNIQWVFIAERAAWWGGFWERLVRSVKDALRKTLGRSSLTFEQLTTILTEIEATINSRPLTYLSDDPRDLSPLCPSHFLVGRRLTLLPEHPQTSCTTDETRSSLIEKADLRRVMLASFWRRWTRDYICELPSAHRFQCRDIVPYKVGELVLLSSKPQGRAVWPLARISEVQPGRDGVIRAFWVVLPNGSEIRRPVQNLHKLEL